MAKNHKQRMLTQEANKRKREICKAEIKRLTAKIASFERMEKNSELTTMERIFGLPNLRQDLLRERQILESLNG